MSRIKRFTGRLAIGAVLASSLVLGTGLALVTGTPASAQARQDGHIPQFPHLFDHDNKDHPHGFEKIGSMSLGGGRPDRG
jgi:hypothetical protein